MKILIINNNYYSIKNYSLTNQNIIPCIPFSNPFSNKNINNINDSNNSEKRKQNNKNNNLIIQKKKRKKKI